MAASHADRNGPNVTLYGAMAKCFASDVAMRVTTQAVQILGGYGYIRDFPLERLMRDAKAYIRDFPLERLMRDAKALQIYEGTNEIQRVVISRSLLGKL